MDDRLIIPHSFNPRDFWTTNAYATSQERTPTPDDVLKAMEMLSASAAKNSRVKVGQYHKDGFRMVEILCRENDDPRAGPMWRVKSVLSEFEYNTPERNLSKETFCEMEVVAWAAR